MSVIDWALYSERAVGRGSLTYTDVINRPLREVMSASGQDPDASFPGFSLAGHTHDASAIVSGTVAPARGGTGLSSPAAGSLLVAAAAAAMTLLAPGASGQVVKSNGSAWASSPIVTADVSDLASAATGITRLGTVTTGAWQASPINDTYLATIGTAGKVANTATTAASANTPSAIVARDASGNFAAGVITATFTGALTGNASTATKLAAAVNINGVAFDGSGNVTVPAAANTLTGTTLAANVVASSLAGVGTLTSGTWSATLIAPAFGGTGVANGNTITVGGNVNTAAAFTTVGGALTLTVTGATNVTLPTSGTLVNTAVTTLASLNSVATITTGVWNATAITDAFLATISTAGKVSNSATTATSLNTPSAIVARDASGNFTAGAVSLGSLLVSSASQATATIQSTGSNDAYFVLKGTASAKNWRIGKDITVANSLEFQASATSGGTDFATVMSVLNTGAVGIASTLTVTGLVTASVGLSITTNGLAVVAGGIAVVTGTTAVQALTATTGTFSSNVTATRYSTTTNNAAALVLQNAAGHNAGLLGNRLDITGSGSADDAILCAFGTIGLVPGNGTVSALTVNTDLSTSFAGDIKVAAAKKVFLDGGSDTYLQESSANVILAIAGGNNGIQIDGSSAPTSAQTRLSVAIGGGIGLQLVTLGATDSGGTGFKLLRVPN